MTLSLHIDRSNPACAEDSYFQTAWPVLCGKLLQAMRSQPGDWGDPGLELNVRCIEIHRLSPLRNPTLRCALCSSAQPHHTFPNPASRMNHGMRKSS
jgi:hypothetical protein